MSADDDVAAPAPSGLERRLHDLLRTVEACAAQHAAAAGRRAVIVLQADGYDTRNVVPIPSWGVALSGGARL